MRAVEKKKQPIFFGYVQANSADGVICVNSGKKGIVPQKTWIENTANSNDRNQFARLYRLAGLTEYIGTTCPFNNLFLLDELPTILR